MTPRSRHGDRSGTSPGPMVAACLVLLGLAAFLALREPTTYLSSYVPLLLLLACPLLHWLMHRGRHHGQGRPRAPEDEGGSA